MHQENKDILIRLEIEPSARSIDYVTDKKQFQLHTLITEQRHPKTWNLSSTIQEDITEGLIQIFSVDEDIIQKFNEMAQDTSLLERAAQAVKQAIQKNNKIYIYGCGATGRLAKQLESAVWRPFWRKVRQSGLWDTLKSHLPGDIEDRLIGEMTGGDRALISALEGFEDLELVGELQLEERGIEKGDAVFCFSEGGETSSVLGTIKAALQLYQPLNPENTEEAKKYLFFIYNNPDDLLRPLDRSRSVIENPAISRINLTTGPQAIAGSLDPDAGNDSGDVHHGSDTRSGHSRTSTGVPHRYGTFSAGFWTKIQHQRQNLDFQVPSYAHHGFHRTHIPFDKTRVRDIQRWAAGHLLCRTGASSRFYRLCREESDVSSRSPRYDFGNGK